jgi:hypothetical protein
LAKGDNQFRKIRVSNQNHNGKRNKIVKESFGLTFLSCASLAKQGARGGGWGLLVAINKKIINK